MPSLDDIPSEVTVRGVVLTVNDQKPIPGALVGLDMFQRTITSDSQGRFEFTSVPLGKNKVLSAKRDGFFCVLTHSGPLPNCVQSVDKAMEDQVLKAGDPAKAAELLRTKTVDVIITLMPAATVAGHVADAAGKPLPEMEVILTYRTVVDGRYVWRMLGGFAKTDADGNYRIDKVEPDTYTLHTPVTADPASGKGCCGYGYAATWYPHTFNEDSAQRIAVAPGENRTADLTLTRQEFQSVTVPWSWNRTDKIGGGGWDLTSAGIRDPLPGNWDRDHHLFHFFLPSGDYHFRFSISPSTEPDTGNPGAWSDGTKEHFMGSVDFTVADAPLTLPSVLTQQPIDIPIHVTAQLTNQEKRKAELPEYSYSSPRVYFRFRGDQRGFNPQMQWNSNAPKSDLAFKGVSPGSHIIEASVPNGSYAYVSSLTCGATNLLREPLPVGPGIPPCDIEAVVRDDLASLTVQLTQEAAAKMKAAGIDVTDLALIPLDDELAVPFSTFVYCASPPEKHNVPPGRYLAVLFDGRTLAYREPMVLNKLLSLGKIVSLAPGQSQTIQLDLSPELDNLKGNHQSVGLGNVLN